MNVLINIKWRFIRANGFSLVDGSKKEGVCILNLGGSR
jgi:hypothetical protein